ncbi:endonuclease domain-containing protein [Streptomyces arenae]
MSSCGKCIRGLLCLHCNSAPGYVRDSVEMCHRMADYLSGKL